jgi:hypothetical protein
MEALKTAIHILNKVPSKSVPKTPYEMWTGRVPSVNHLRMWRSPAEAKVFNPTIAKLDPKTVSYHFIGYPEMSKGFRFYCPDKSTKFVESRHAVFFEDKIIWGSGTVRKIDLEKKRVYTPNPVIQEPFFSIPAVNAPPVQVTAMPTPAMAPPAVTMNKDVEPIHQAPEEPVATQGGEQQQPQTDEASQAQAYGRPQRTRKSAIPDNYEVYNSKEVQMENDPTSFEEAMRSEYSSKWLDAMKDEIKSMSTNEVWDLEKIPKGAKTVGCKWVYKTKYDSQGNIDKFKARLVAKGYTQREGIDFNETFFPVSCKDSFRIIMALVAHYDLELYQMDVKTAFLDGDLDETVYMVQPKGFVMECKEKLGCHLKKSIYGLKQASRQWYLKFDKNNKRVRV